MYDKQECVGCSIFSRLSYVLSTGFNNMVLGE